MTESDKQLVEALREAAEDAAERLEKLLGGNIHKILADRREVGVVWCVADVLSMEVAEGLTEDQAWEILRRVDRCADCSVGITWDTIEDAILEFRTTPNLD